MGVHWVFLLGVSLWLPQITVGKSYRETRGTKVRSGLQAGSSRSQPWGVGAEEREVYISFLTFPPDSVSQEGSLCNIEL